MSRKPASFTEADLRRAVRVAEKTGRIVELVKGGTVIRLFEPGQVVDGKPAALGPERRLVF